MTETVDATAATIPPFMRYADAPAAIGSREYGARDLEGRLWSFGTYRRGAPTA